MLEGNDVTKAFGGLVAVNRVDFKVNDKEIMGLIGPNGSGKTTLFNCVTGVYRPTSGKIEFLGKDITGQKTNKIMRLGMSRVFQITKPFLNMTPLDNVTVAMFPHIKNITVGEARKEAENYLQFTGVPKERWNLPVKNLTLFSRKMVELSRALAAKPKLLLIDEYVAGLNPTEIVECNKLINRIRDDLGITIFWVEHVMRAIMEVSERIMVLHHGQKIAEGTPKEVAGDKQVIEAYLGERYAHG
jgi:branched-chain amino acid transport system ATP-binding protein